MNKENTYQTIVKSMALFGGVQVFTILISIIRSKFIAVWLGPMGMGIASLLNATMGLINGFTNFGLDRSAVKDISFGVSKDDVSQQVKIIQIVRRLVWFTVLLGVFVMIIASSILSEIAFGNSDYTFAFIWVSIALLFKQLTNGELAILQGLRRLSNLAKANLLGNLLGLLITLPLYYFYRIDAIVPSMIIASITSYIFTFYFSFKEGRGGNPISNKIALREGKEMIHLGVMLSISSLIALATAYIIQVFISNIGSIDEVGLYNAGFVILNTYVGLIFTAMATDYYPRLAAIHDKIEEVRKMVFEQAYMAILIITPIIVVFLMFAPFIINLLYSEEFSP
ncbi:MAG: oligosaccharide flippase family protein, partial [Flavobacteriaceae bacterium]|nr:oligosaccharide flippase family protein [Flavobacteriaceae bacterium]